MKCCFLTAGGRFMSCHHLIVFIVLSLLFITKESFAQTTVITTPRSPRAVRHSTLGTWTNFTADALKDDDNKYMKYKFVPSWSGSDRLVCYNFDFSDIPDHAVIEKLYLKISRFKEGKPDVSDLQIYFSKYGGDRVMGPNLSKPDYYPTSEGSAYYSEVGSSAGYGTPSDVGSYGPYTYTAADLKSPDFNIYINCYRYGVNGNTYLYFEQVQVWVEYTIPNSVTTSIQAANERDILDLKQYNRSVHVKGLRQGRYQLTVSDLSGRIIQQSRLINSVEQSVALNEQCKGYCIITIQGEGKRKTIKTFVQ